MSQKGRSCLGDLIYRYISSDQFSPECLLDCLDLSSEHQAIEIANRVESSIYLWHKRTNSKPATNTRTSWEMVKELMVDPEKLELMADRAESLLLSLKQRFPGLPQTALDMSKIQYNKVSLQHGNQIQNPSVSFYSPLNGFFFPVLGYREIDSRKLLESSRELSVQHRSTYR